MFKELYAVARHTPLHLQITGQEGGQLKVIVTPLPTGKAKDIEGLSKQFAAIGTPEDLDAEFIPKLNEYATSVNTVRAEIKLPEISVEKTASATRSDKRKAAKEAKQQKLAEKRKERDERKAAKKAAREKKMKEANEKRAATREAKKSGKPAAPAKSAGIQLPGAAPAKASTKSAAAPAPAAQEKKGYLASLPGKPEVLADYQALVAAHGEKKVGRKFFIKKAKTGRRYEKLWKNWADFMKWVAKQPAGGAATAPLEPADAKAERIVAQGEKPAKAKKADDWPFPVGTSALPSKAAKKAAPDTDSADDAPVKGQSKDTNTDVYDEAGTYLSSITTKPVIGKHIGLVTHGDLLRVTAIDTRPSGGLDVTVVPDPEETKRHSEAIAESVRAQAAARQKTEKVEPTPIAVLERKSRALLGTYADEINPADVKIVTVVIELAEHPGRTFMVDAVTPGVEILAHEIHTKPWMLFNDQGNKLGDTTQIYAAGDPVAELSKDGDYRVHEVHEHDKAYTVKDARPKFQVFTEDDELIVEYKSAPVVGERLVVPDRAHPFKVLAVEGHRVTARKILATKNRLTDHASGDLLGHTEEVYDVADQVAELAPKDYRVVKVELDAYLVKLSKPRVVGPTATVAATSE